MAVTASPVWLRARTRWQWPTPTNHPGQDSGQSRIGSRRERAIGSSYGHGRAECLYGRYLGGRRRGHELQFCRADVSRRPDLQGDAAHQFRPRSSTPVMSSPTFPPFRYPSPGPWSCSPFCGLFLAGARWRRRKHRHANRLESALQAHVDALHQKADAWAGNCGKGSPLLGRNAGFEGMLPQDRVADRSDRPSTTRIPSTAGCNPGTPASDSSTGSPTPNPTAESP